MAYGLKILLEHSDFNNNTSRIEILERDYAGDYIERDMDGDEPFTVTYGTKSTEGMPIVYGSEATIHPIALVDFEFIDLFTADARKYRVDHYFNSQLVGSWFILPEKWSEPLTAAPYVVEITAVDGLGTLKDASFTDSSGAAYTGRKTLLEIIQLILEKTGLELDINTAINWKEGAQLLGTDMLAIHTIDCKIFIDLNCYEVLENILPECRIFQRNGQWWIVSNSNFLNDTITYFNYPWPAVTDGTTHTTPVKASGYWIEDEPTLEILPAIKQLTVIQNYGYNANIIENGSFDKFDDQLERFYTWINNGVTPQQRPLNDNGDKYVYIPGQQYPDTFGNEGYGLINKSMEKIFPIKQTTSVFTLELSYALMGSAYSCLMFISLRLVGADATYYLRRIPYFETRDAAGFEWKQVTVGGIPQGDDYISLKSSTNWISSGPNRGKYSNRYDLVTAYNAAEVINHFESFKASVAGIPVSGNLQLYLYVPYTNRPQIAGSCFTAVKINLLDETEDKYPTQQIITATNTENNTYVPDDETLIIGDYPDIVNSEIIYAGGLARMDATHTTNWTILGHTYGYTFAELIARIKAASQNTPRQNYQIRMQDLSPGLNMVIDDIDGTRRLLENGITYDNRMCAIDGQYSELLPLDLEQPAIATTTEYDESQTTSESSSTTGNTPAPVNSDERVSIANEEGMKTSAPGFMNDEYFETTQNEETGYVLIKPRTGILVTYDAHGFIVGDNIKATTTGWTKAKADSKANAKCVGKVCQVIDENTFRYITSGLLAGTYTAGTRYYLSTVTAGADMEEPATWTAGQYRQYIGTGTPDGLMVEIDAGEEVAQIDNSCMFSFKFEVAEAFTFVCPEALKFISMEHQQVNAPTLSVALNTNLAKYDNLVITPDAVGLVILKGTFL